MKYFRRVLFLGSFKNVFQADEISFEKIALECFCDYSRVDHNYLITMSSLACLLCVHKVLFCDICKYMSMLLYVSVIICNDGKECHPLKVPVIGKVGKEPKCAGRSVAGGVLCFRQPQLFVCSCSVC